MKRFLIIPSLLTLIVSSTAVWCCAPDDYSFYIKVDSGVSCSTSTNICAPYPPWNPAFEGYNAALGNAPIAGFSVGCELWDIMDLEVNIASRSTFKYRKFQTPTTGGSAYTRTFDLSVTSILFSTNILGLGFPCLNWDVWCGKLYPLLGVGLGASNLLITNYRTVGLAPTGDSTPYKSFSAENQYTLRRNFTYTILIGLEYNHDARWAVGTGYRWFDAGHFNGPQYQRIADGSAVDVACDTWKMRFGAHEWFIEFKILI